ncbi:helix-turn-helix domain-containing protein [Bacillus sp. WMMC1349]|uniref:helix-turn-helix domain-containing protein n=1 Tax=Bacillus sp. WMMC1349 TaxID=2736254 RepID=UPI00155262A7|nr:helix-turn-helix domain-containing protein [Bacillus sp. WMMC1349]NPC92870.1 helix-turn-helix domain-containing protein [Bacillus sp. WMMC1349]
MSTMDEQNLKEVSEEIVNVQNVMSILDIASKQTIYSYIAKGKLIPINKEDWKIDGGYEFNLSDVLKLKEDMKPTDLTTSDVAKRLGVAQATVVNYINRGMLSAYRGLFKGKPCNFIKEEDVDQFLKQHKVGKRYTKEFFYRQDLNVVLLQKFIKGDRAARFMSLDGDMLAITDEDEHLSYNELMEAGYVPAYDIKRKKPITKEGFIQFEFKKHSAVHNPMFTLLDIFYQEISPVNMRINPGTDNNLLLEVRPCLISKLPQDLYEILQNYLVKGEIHQRRNGTYVDSDLEIIRLKVTKSQKDSLEKKANRLNKTLEELILETISRSELENKLFKEEN